MYFILTIDTEADNQWDHGCELTTHNIHYIPRFQNLCEKYGIKPTYLVTSEICVDNYAQEIFKKYVTDNKAEIGAHLHSWTTPPFINESGYRYNDPNHVFASELPSALLSEKLTALTQQIEGAFGKRPKSFRSGRYGFNEPLAKNLVELGYIIDSSVTPFTDWSKHKGLPDGQGGIDFMQNDPFPYSYNFPSGSLVEIPVTILPTKFPLNRSYLLARHYFRNANKILLYRVMRRLFFLNQPYWFRPFDYMNIEAISCLVHEAQRIELPFLVMMFHSSELMPGCSIYRKNESDIDDLFLLIENIFILIQRENILALTLSEAAEKY
jgi:hypothetical protein